MSCQRRSAVCLAFTSAIHLPCGHQRWPGGFSPVRLLLAVMLLLGCGAAARGDLPEIRFDRLTPLGGAAGSVVEVQIAAAKPDGVERLLFDHPGLSAEFVEDKKFRITIAADVPAGWYDVWLVGRWGVSNPRLFAVSHGLEQVADTEPNNTIEQAQLVPVDSVVNGTSDGNGEDTFHISLTAGQRIVMDCLAQRLDSQLDATLILRSAEGRVLATSGDWYGSDPFLDFTAPATGDYFVTVHDLSYRGGQPYRLVFTLRPHVENVFPRAVQVGRAVRLTAWGRNFGSAGTVSELTLNDQPLEKFSWDWTPPADVFDIGGYRFQEHPTAHSVMPTAATCTLTGMQVQPVIAGVESTPIPVLLTDREVLLEAEPNEDRDSPQPLELPCVLSGRFDHERDADWFAFEVPENGSYEFDVYSERIGGNADPYLVILDDQGNRLNELDDYGHRINAFDGHLRDPSGRVSLAGGRRYRLLVQDRYRRGGPRYQYVLAVRLAEPDFHVATIHSSNPGPAGTTIWKGGTASLDVVIHQSGGYNGPVTLTAEDLPPGLHAAPTTIRNTNRGVFVLWADETAVDWTGPIRLVATGVHEGESFRREVRPFTRVMNQGNSSRPMRQQVVAMVNTAPFRLHFEQSQVQVNAGEEQQVTVRVDRLWDGAGNSITLRPLQFPGGITMNVTEIAAGADSATVTLKVQPNLLPGEYTLSVDGQSQVPFSEDPEAASRPNTLVSQPGLPLSLIVLPQSKP